MGRHAQLVAFEKSDLMFVCMLKPLSTEITIDEKEIEEAKVIDSSFQVKLTGNYMYGTEYFSL